MILFLDFDGVLHSATGRNKLWSRAKTLARVLRQYPEVRIVISSSWREQRSLDQLREVLGEELGGKVISATPILRDRNPRPRQAEIEAWLAENTAAGYLALDDMPELFAKDCPWLIVTDGGEGLDGRSVQLLRTRLDGFYCK